MRIANPIYDAVFRYLMEDKESAILFLSTIIGAEIKHLDFNPTETPIKYAGGLEVLRMDFSATIVQENGDTQQIIIELQKIKYHLEVVRFRKYLGKQYSNPDLTTEYLTRRNKTLLKGIPILPIYILGNKLTRQKIPVLKVQRQYIDMITQEVLDLKNDFVEALTHDGIFVQTPHLEGKMRTELEHLLLIFDQSNIDNQTTDDSMKNHILSIDENSYPPKFQRLIRRLKQAIAEPQVVEQMEAEDDYLTVFELYQRDVERNKQEKLEAEKRAEVAEKKTEIAENRTEIAEKKADEERKQKEEAFKQTITAIRQLHTKKNMDIATLMALFNKSETEIKAILEK